LIPYRLYIDLSGGADPNGYFNIGEVLIDEMPSSFIENNPYVERRGFSEIKVKNYPYKYHKLGGDKYRLYDIILSISPSQPIYLKYESVHETVYSYFGPIDCSIKGDGNDDEKEIVIKPYILDQYTELLENSENDVRLFDETNQIINGDFKEWGSGVPVGWSQNLQKYLLLERSFKNDSSVLAMSDMVYVNEESITPKGTWDANANIPNLDLISNPQNGDYYGCDEPGTYTNQYGEWEYDNDEWISYNSEYVAWMPVTNRLPLKVWHPVFPEEPIQLWQIKEHILKDRQMNISFVYGLTGSTNRYKKLPFDVILSDSESSDIYRLLKDGSWTKELSGTDKIFYGGSKNIAIDITILNEFRKYSLPTTKTPVNGTIQLIFYRPYDFEVENTWDENYKLLISDVILSASSIELKTVKIVFTPEYLVTEGENSDKIFWKSRKPKANFYSTDFPVSTSVNDFFDGNGKPINSMLKFSDDNRVTLTDILKFFEEQTSISYKFELSTITVFKCDWISAKKRRFRAVCEFSREEIKTTKGTDGEYLEPEGEGWVATGDVSSGRMLWVRTPFNGIELPWLKEDIDHSQEFRTYGNLWPYTDKVKSVKQYPVTVDNEITVTNAIDFREVVRKIYTETHISLRGKQVYSNFLWNDTLPEAEENAVYSDNATPTTDNYITNYPNILNNILALHTFELSTEPTNDEEKTILKMSYNDLMNALMGMFPQCYWKIDSDGNWHFEHIKHFDNTNTAKNLIGFNFDYLGSYRSWNYIKEKLFSRKEIEVTNSGYADFATAEVTYDKIVSNKRGQDVKNTVRIENISTDIKYCAENPDGIDNGIILLAYEVVNGENVCKYGLGQKSGKSFINADLSIATLLSTYATYEGVWQKGQINGNDAAYPFTKRVRQGEEIIIKGILLDKVIATDLGIGLVTNRTVDVQNELTRITAIYRYKDDFPIVGIDENPIQAELATLKNNPVVLITGITGVGTLSEVLEDGGSPITERGVCWSTSINPTILDGKSASGSGIGSYNNLFTILVAGNYYLRSYAINSVGTAYSNNVSFIISS